MVRAWVHANLLTVRSPFLSLSFLSRRLSPSRRDRSATRRYLLRMTDSEIEMHYTPPTSDTIQTKPFPIRGNILRVLSLSLCLVISLVRGTQLYTSLFLSPLPLPPRTRKIEHVRGTWARGCVSEEVQGLRSRGQCTGCLLPDICDRHTGLTSRYRVILSPEGAGAENVGGKTFTFYPHERKAQIPAQECMFFRNDRRLSLKILFVYSISPSPMFKTIKLNDRPLDLVWDPLWVIFILSIILSINIHFFRWCVC